MASNKSNKLVTGIVVIGVLLVLTLIINIVFASFSNTIAMFLGGYSTTQYYADAKYDNDYCYQEGYEVSSRAEAEGAVLLKNKNNCLPLAESTKVTLLGAMSFNYVLGGTGSAGGSDDENTTMMYDAFTEAGLDVNETAWKTLATACGASKTDYSGRGKNAAYDNIKSSDWTGHTKINEFSRTTYETLKSSLVASGYTNYAIVTFGRSGAEGASPSMDIENAGSTLNRTYLELSDNEKELLKFCKANFSHTIVLVNSAAPIECGFLDNDTDYNVDAAFWIGHTGEAGITGVGTLITGRVNPSGALVDTFSYDMSTNPTYWNTDNNQYANTEFSSVSGAGSVSKFYQYEEGIYIGYRYYETADAVGYFDSTEFKGIEKFKNGKVTTGYDGVVQFPFGYNASYTSFDLEITKSNIQLKNGEENSITVKVTNTGSYAGKKTVQLYMEAPYAQDSALGLSSKGKNLEKSKVVLIGFAKTKELASKDKDGSSEEVTITFRTDDLASFDNYGKNCYVLEKGDYYFNIQNNAHCWSQTASAKNAVYDSVKVNLTSTIVYNESGVGARDSDETVAKNAMDDATAGDGTADSLFATGYLSRSSFAEGMTIIMKHESNETANEKTSDAVAKMLTTHALNDYTYTKYENGQAKSVTVKMQAYGNNFGPLSSETPDGKKVSDAKSVKWEQTYYVEEDENGDAVYDGAELVIYSSADEIVSGKYHKLGCGDMGLEDKNSDSWELLVSQAVMSEVIAMQGGCGQQVPAVPSIGKAYQQSKDGPGEPANGTIAGATWYPCAVIIAATWNESLAEELGVSYGNWLVLGSLGNSYAPAMNTHRSPFGGRNFEYYSEDGFIAGKIGGRQVAGIQSTGSTVFIKHMGLNDGDTNRNGACTWANEQAIREIYSRPYEISVKEFDASGIMSSLNRIGSAWGHYGHYTTMLRDEWGWSGFLITDGDGSNGPCYNNPTIWLYSAEGAMLSSGLFVNAQTTVDAYGDITKTNFGQQKLQTVLKYCAYQFSHSGGIEGYQAWWWVSIWVALDVLIIAGIVLVTIFILLPAIKARKKAN